MKRRKTLIILFILFIIIGAICTILIYMNLTNDTYSESESYKNFMNIMNAKSEIELIDEEKEKIENNNIAEFDIKIQMFMGNGETKDAINTLIENIAFSKEADNRGITISKEKANSMKKEIDSISFEKKDLQQLNMTEKEIKERLYDNRLRIEKKMILKNEIFDEIFNGTVTINDSNIIEKVKKLQIAKNEISNKEDVSMELINSITNYCHQIEEEYYQYIIARNS